MSPTKNPRAIRGLKNGLSGGQAEAITAAPMRAHSYDPDSHIPGNSCTYCGRGQDDPLHAPAGEGFTPRTKPVRVTLDLDQETYAALNQWLGSAAAEVGAPVSKARALRAMIRAVDLDKSIGLVVIDLLRRDGQPPGAVG